MSTKPRRLGKYELQTRIGRGGGGDVWKALDTQLQRPVAIKLLHADLQSDPSFVTRFEHEAQFIAALRHPNIIQIHDFAFETNTEDNSTIAYMVMDYVEGETLEDYILNTARKQRFPQAGDLVYLFTAVGLALDYAHQKGTIHRDIKPANILIDQRVTSARALGRPILTDFGIAKMQSVQTKTVIGAVLGTPRYMAPEQAQGSTVTHYSDLYSLGIILYEMNTGVTPFRSEGVLALLRQHMYETPTSPDLINPNISPALTAVILKSIAKEPEARYASASAMTIAIAEALNVPIPESLRPRPALENTGSADPPTNVHLTPYQISLSPSWASYPQEQIPPATARIQNSQSSPIIYNPAQFTPASSITPQGTWTNQGVAPAIQPGASLPKTIRNTKRYILLLALLIVGLLASGVGAFVLLHPGDTGTNPGPTSIGQISFSSSNPNAPAGTYDILRIDLQNLPPPPQGYTYYAWIQDLPGSEHIVPHWQLSPQNKEVHLDSLTFPSVHTLYSPNSFFLITLEQSNSSPVIPNIDPKMHAYYAQITSTKPLSFTVLKCPTDPSSTVCINGQ